MSASVHSVLASCERRPCVSTRPFDIVAIAASKGGLAALSTVLAGLPENFPAAIGLVQHLEPSRVSVWAEILNDRTALSVKWAEEGEPLSAGTVYVAPPNRHFAVKPEQTIQLSDNERVRFWRPPADLFFESVAKSFGRRAIAVVLTGMLDDGAKGLHAIKTRGGRTLAQDPGTAVGFGMPTAAIRTGSVDFVLPLDRIAPALITFTMATGADSLFQNNQTCFAI
jgi:two-component system, chemotaxis family, protein-glutamate methylesterase/glutaminase